MKTRKQQILDTVCDAGADLLYYDRKECEVLPIGEIEDAVRDGDITIEEIVEAFEKVVRVQLT